MTEPSLSHVMHTATHDVESRLDPVTVWDAGRRRRRRSAAVVAGGAAAAVVAVAAVSAGVAGLGSTPTPAPTPTPPGPTAPDLTVDDAATVGVVGKEHLLPMSDPADWAGLPPYPRDLGYWLSPERPVPLAVDPVTRATTALQYDLGGQANVVVIGDDGRWRWIDVADYDLDDNDGGLLGMHRGSLSPDGTRLTLGLADGVAVVDLTTAAVTSYEVPGMGARWGGRFSFWTSDGDAVLLSRGYWVEGDDDSFAYPEGWRVDLDDGEVTRVPFDPEHAALLGDGTVLANLWSVRTGHEWTRFAPGGDATALDISTDLLGVLSEPTAQTDLVVARRELTAFFPDRRWDRSGFVVLDATGEVVSMLPVKRVNLNGGGGRVLGWVDQGVVLLAMPGEGGNPLVTVAWDVATGELWRGPEVLTDTVVSLPGSDFGRG
jgi:hypothetical protein